LSSYLLDPWFSVDEFAVVGRTACDKARPNRAQFHVPRFLWHSLGHLDIKNSKMIKRVECITISYTTYLVYKDTAFHGDPLEPQSKHSILLYR